MLFIAKLPELQQGTMFCELFANSNIRERINAEDFINALYATRETMGTSPYRLHRGEHVVNFFESIISQPKAFTKFVSDKDNWEKMRKLFLNYLHHMDGDKPYAAILQMTSYTKALEAVQTLEKSQLMTTMLGALFHHRGMRDIISDTQRDLIERYIAGGDDKNKTPKP
ncbi:MAG TPA: hypothetical protein VNC84_07240 [Gammaproteobacteria bacterium]|jgi:hypothetical protein|nr:hypothetical protein [Gammaproteobacteria bacterium]